MAKMIGVVGGVGPFAGLDLVRKIFEHTPATCDQEHLPVTLLSLPEKIGDRTAFLIGESDVNPGVAIAEIICSLHAQGAVIIGIPCNTAHAESIFREITSGIPSGITLLHIVEEVAHCIVKSQPEVKKVGILSTTGTSESGVYPQVLSRFGLTGIQVPEEMQSRIHQAIYSPDYGIKACSQPVSQKAVDELTRGIGWLKGAGAGAVIAGCTEIPLAISAEHVDGIPVIDATAVLAKALIRESLGSSSSAILS